MLAATTEDGDPALIFCFDLLHDTQRENETVDPAHGPRAASFAAQLRDEGALPLEESRFRSLATALRLHSNGEVSSNRTIGTCWDADRLHLPRVGITPDPALFSTAAAHGRGSLPAAEVLRREGPPGWDALVTLAGATRLGV